MSVEQSETLGNFLFIALCVSLIADFVLSGAWNKIYFTIGLPIFIKRFPAQGPFKGIPFQYLFESEFQNDWIASFAFKSIDDHSYGLREKFFRPRFFRYIPLMHGLVIFEYEKSQVVVKGMANWSTIWLAFYFLLSTIGLLRTSLIEIVGLVVFILLDLVITYSMQTVAFSKVGKFAAELFSKEYRPSSSKV